MKILFKVILYLDGLYTHNYIIWLRALPPVGYFWLYLYVDIFNIITNCIYTLSTYLFYVSTTMGYTYLCVRVYNSDISRQHRRLHGGGDPAAHPDRCPLSPPLHYGVGRVARLKDGGLWLSSCIDV